MKKLKIELILLTTYVIFSIISEIFNGPEAVQVAKFTIGWVFAFYTINIPFSILRYGNVCSKG